MDDLFDPSELPALIKVSFLLRATTKRGPPLMQRRCIEAWPRPVSRKTSGDDVKKLLLFEEVRRVQ